MGAVQLREKINDHFDNYLLPLLGAEPVSELTSELRLEVLRRAPGSAREASVGALCSIESRVTDGSVAVNAGVSDAAWLSQGLPVNRAQLRYHVAAILLVP